jgi:hypothetical protein
MLDTAPRPTMRHTIPSPVRESSLTWRDVVTTALAAFSAAFAFAVVRGWDWPLAGGYRSGTLVVGAVGLAACAIGGSAMKDLNLSDPFISTASILGFAAFALIVAGLVVPTKTAFVALAATSFALWIVATTRHALAR